jgi:hypothetical protein
MAYASFRDFYPYYLSEHRNPTCRKLHFAGTWVVIALLCAALFTRNSWFLLAVPVAGYGFAWVGHFGYEKNRPATFKHPLYSLMGDWVMFKDICVGKISL